MINIKNIYFMLSYAYQNLNTFDYSHFIYEKFLNAQDLYASILTKGIKVQIKRGISKNYIREESQVSFPKGKILLNESLKLITKKEKKISCEYETYSENILINKIIKSTLILLVKSKKIKNTRIKEIKKVLVYFQYVDLIELNSICWNKIQYNRNNLSYKMLLNICYLASNDLIVEENSTGKLLDKITDEQKMYRLYENFVKNYYKTHFPKLKPESTQIKWKTDDGIIDFLPTMKTDITLSYANKKLVIDTKYYSKSLQQNSLYNSNKTIHSHNLYQIFAYVKNMEGNVTGMLLYAKTNEEMTPNFQYQLQGNKILVEVLDLNQPFIKISQQLDNIIKKNFDIENISKIKIKENFIL